MRVEVLPNDRTEVAELESYGINTGTRRKKKPALPPIVIDTREQLPLNFAPHPTLRGTIKSGDYSLLGYERVVAAERKSKVDAWRMLTNDRPRFERCLARLAELDRSVVVIECSLAEFCLPPFVRAPQQVTAATAVGSYISWMAQYGVPVVWAENRAYAERLILRFLASWWKHRSGRFAAAGELAVTAVK